MDKVDITIIGAGVVGLAVAAKVSNSGNSCLLLEKNKSFGQETSSRNSEVIHSGIYYPGNSLKAQLCVKGNSLLYEHCKKYNINHQKTGKAIVAITQEELTDLERLRSIGINNGVTGLELVSRDEMKELEPEVEAKAGLLSPTTGIIDTHKLMQSFLGIAQERGAIISYDSEVMAIAKINDGFRITVRKDNYTFDTRILINCAGLGSDKIASLAGIDINKAGYKLHYSKGNYFRTRQKLAVKRLIYPVPSLTIHSLGIHLTLDLAGQVRFGPDAHYLDTIDYTLDEGLKQSFYTAIVKYLPSIKLSELFADTCGIRPKLQGPNDGFKDFIITDERAKNLPGLINLIGIESPGLTSSIAIAEYVANML